MSKSFLGVIAAIVLIFAGIFLINGNKTKDSKTSSSSTATLTNHTIGTSPNNVTLLEYGDFQCQYCAEYYPIVKQVQEKYNDQVVFQFRHFPITTAHPNAFAAARASEGAAKQNKFWEMYNILYQNQTQWASLGDPTSTFESYAKALGMNVAQFTKDSASSATNDFINADSAEATKIGVTGTPTFFINGKKINVTQKVEDFSKQIDAALAKGQTSKPTN